MSAVPTIDRVATLVRPSFLAANPDVTAIRPALSLLASAIRPLGHVPELTAIRLVADTDEELDIAMIEREFPTLRVERTTAAVPGDLVIDDFAWRGAFDFRPFDEAVERSRPSLTIAVRGLDAPGVALGVLARYQRLVQRRNRASSTPSFDAVIDSYTSVFDRTLAVEVSDLDHALDTWQWTLRLLPSASLSVQIAAVLHDIDRLESEPEERIEHRAHRAPDDPQAARGAERAVALLRGVGIDEITCDRVRCLVAGRADDTSDAQLLDDADALSFLSLSSAKYADHFGLAQARRKVSFLVARLGQPARERMRLFRLRPDVERLLMIKSG